MKRYLLIMLVLVISATMAQASKQNRGLLAFVTGSEIQVSWRMRSTDDPFTTRYKLYANGTLCQTLTSRTTVRLAKSAYANATFSLVVENENGEIVDRQDNVKVLSSNYLDIPLKAPLPIVGSNGFTITYSPGEGSACDMDGDGEQEIVLKWMPSALYDGASSTVGREYIDCYKLNGTRLWRIDLGQNAGAGNNLPFMCYDFDQDGKGELIVKTAPGSLDAQGRYVGASLKGYSDRNKLYYRGSDGLPTQGEEWMTCYDGTTGKELGTVDYWPLFGIQSNWYPGGSDTYTYGRRGNGFKGAVVYLDVDGKKLPCCYSQRGIYSYVYASTYSWDGKTFRQVWRHASDQSGQGLFAEGAHSVCAGDVDGDGYDEVVIGAACIDHDGKVKWRTGLGHGDALHLGEFSPYNKGLEVYRITENASAYDACLMDAATGKVLASLPYQSGDVDRGIIMDVDSTYAGNEFFCNTYSNIYTCQGMAVYRKDMGNNNGYPNFRIYWDGDLLDEHFSGNKISKYNTGWQGFDRIASLWSTHRAQSINGTKENAILVCDLLGDWREELILYTAGGDAPAGYDFALRIITSNYSTEYKLPWLRDDHTYDLAIAWQNVGYCQPPHLGYNPVEYYASLMKSLENARWTDKFMIDFEDGDYSMWKVSNSCTQSIVTVDGSNAYDIYVTSGRTATFDFSAYKTSICEKYEFAFDWGTGGSNTDASSLVINANNAEGRLAVVNIPKYRNTTITFNDSYNNLLASDALGNDYSVPSSLYHFVITGSSEGVYMTVTRGDRVVVNNAKLSDTYTMVTGLTANMGRSYNHTTFDNISLRLFEEKMKGDVNLDDRLSISDVAYLLDVLLGRKAKTPTSDINADGKVDISDVWTLSDMLIGKIR